ncbi:transcription regulator GAL80 [Ascoidea rubescens DSM 1968]|uniref:NAD(P)-binding protein n=1 Tax=Ascoidea rubescens DSM 1968 TaxID=1344418 RepID=A0A1D2VGB8_9ASCO|nr:NAD(P)-binding protein [Ascoidea rubescens DSM 1968]ODV60686.1 NAD(P)-binding protein [Ascoidea rubescens DSM 1968]
MSPQSSLASKDSIKVGIIGLSIGSGVRFVPPWAYVAHYPALAKIPEKYQISSILNSTLSSAEAAVNNLSLNTTKPFDSLDKFAQYESNDLVTVSVRVPLHKQLLLPNIESNKNIFSEWPLGASTNEAESILKLVKEKDLKTVIGLQKRKAPAILKIKELISSNKIGRITSVSLSAVSELGGPTRAESLSSYIFESKNGANFFTIPFGHTLDGLLYAVGKKVKSVKANVLTLYKEQQLVDLDSKLVGKVVSKDTVDHISIAGLLTDNTPITIEFRGGSSSRVGNRNLHVEIHGTKGDILYESDSAFSELAPIDLSYSYEGSDGVVKFDNGKDYNATVDNVLGLYESYYEYKDTQGSRQGFEKDGFPTFEDSVILHRLLDRIVESSNTGKEIDVKDIYEF